MNNKLRKVGHQKATAHNRFFTMGRTDKLWHTFRKFRNQSTKLRTQSIKKYFNEKCGKIEHGNSRQFWNVVKPFITDKMKSGNNNITLKKGDIK